jgi:hypothetical protein
MEDVVVVGAASRERRPRDRDHVFDQVGPIEAARDEILLHPEHGDTRARERRHLVVEAGRVRLAVGAQAKADGLLPVHRVVDGVALQHDVQVRARRAQRVHQPEDGVVLLLEGRAVGARDDVQHALAHGCLLTGSE